MPAHERDHLVHPGPTAETADDLELWEIHGDLIEVSRMAEVIWAVVGVVHRRVDADRDAELRGLGVERVVTAVARGKTVDEGGHAEGLEALLLHQMLQLAHARHALERVHADA